MGPLLRPVGPPDAPGWRRSRPATGEPSGLAAAGSPAARVSVTAPPFFPPPRSRPPPPPHTHRCHRRLGCKVHTRPWSADPVERREARAAPHHVCGPQPPPGGLQGDLPPLCEGPGLRRWLQWFAGPQTPSRRKCVCFFFIPGAWGRR